MVVMPHTLEPSADSKGMILSCNTLSGGVHMVSVIVGGFTYTSQLNIPFV